MILPALTVAAAVAALVRPPVRLRWIAHHRRRGRGTRSRPHLLSPVVVRAVCLVAGLCLGLAGAGIAAVALGLLGAVVAPRLLARAEPPDVTRARRALAAELPWVLDLLAAVVGSGAPPTESLAVVGPAVGGELGRRLALIHGHLLVGVPPDEAWAAAGRDGGEPLGLVGEAFAAAAVDGSRLAGRLQDQARDARSVAAAQALAAAQRVGVRAVLPLGLCFLPAFIAVGVVPVVAAALGHLR